MASREQFRDATSARPSLFDGFELEVELHVRKERREGGQTSFDFDLVRQRGILQTVPCS